MITEMDKMVGDKLKEKDDGLEEDTIVFITEIMVRGCPETSVGLSFGLEPP